MFLFIFAKHNKGCNDNYPLDQIPLSFHQRQLPEDSQASIVIGLLKPDLVGFY